MARFLPQAKQFEIGHGHLRKHFLERYIRIGVGQAWRIRLRTIGSGVPVDRQLGRLTDGPVQLMLPDQEDALTLRVEQARQVQVLGNLGR